MSDIKTDNKFPLGIKKTFDESKKYFPTPLQEFQMYDKYSRYNYELGRRETWIEIIDRVVNFLKELSQNLLDKEDYERIKDAILNMKVMPSMRLIATAGEAARRNNIAIYNCSAIPIDSIDAFVEELLILMAGTGAGISVEKVHVDKLPEVQTQTGTLLSTFPIPDSTEGWGKAFRLGMEAWFTGNDIQFDYSLIRPAGAVLKTKGGRSSGPEPLRKLLDFTRKIILSRQGMKLRPIDCHDIGCMVGESIVSGGHRRSAIISLFDIDDEEMMNCKSGINVIGNEHRYMANNSVIWKEPITAEQFLKQMYLMISAQRGEPGIFSRIAANVTKPSRRESAEFLTNPSLRKGTLVYTTNGIFPIEKLENKDFLVRNLDGEDSQATCFLSGKNKPLYEVVLANGQSYFATKEHRWPIINRLNHVKKLSTNELRCGMYLPVIRKNSLDFGDQGTRDEGFLAGWITGDGWITITQDGKKQIGMMLAESDIQLKAKLENQLVKIGCESKFQKRQRGKSIWYEINTQSKSLVNWCHKFGVEGKQVGIPKIIWSTASEDFRKGFIDGIFSSDGCVERNKKKGNINYGSIITLTSAHKNLITEIQSLLGFYGINGSIYCSKHGSSFPNKKDYNKIYERYDLKIGNQINVYHFAEVFPLSHLEKNQKLQKTQKNKLKGLLRIRDIKLSNVKEDVWDISVKDKTHCFQLAYSMTGNCAEILLLPYQFCNLSQVVARPEDTIETLKNKVELATIVGTIQAMATKFPGLRPMWKENCERERLLGVDINGQADCPLLQPGNRNLPTLFSSLREHAIRTNQKYAKKLGINPAAAVTCVKPNGNSSQLLNCSSGLHARHYKYYIRNVRIQAQSPLRKLMEDQGVPMDPENNQTKKTANTFVIHFPIKSPTHALLRENLSAVDQCEHWKNNKLYWTEHNPSVTILYHEDEAVEMIQWIWKNKDIIGGMSFLPIDDAQYKQMPYTKIDREEYEKRKAEFPEIDFSKIHIYEKNDYTTSAQELSCSSGSCEIDYTPNISKK